MEGFIHAFKTGFGGALGVGLAALIFLILVAGLVSISRIGKPQMRFPQPPGSGQP